ncbi:MAG TPA: hypothetical protein VF518_05595 [Polyangia bacterium]
MLPPWNEWLRRLRHDLVKRVLWPARDRKDMGGSVQPGELVARLVDEEGNPASVEEIWAALRADAPWAGHPGLTRFEAILLQAAAAAQRDDWQGVLALEPAFDRLVVDLAREES